MSINHTAGRMGLVAVIAAIVALFAPAAHADSDVSSSSQRVWMVGDSITEGTHMPNRERDSFGAQTVRRICGGRTHCDGANYVGSGGQCLLIDGCNGHRRMLDAIDDVLADGPTVVVIEVGRNDLCHFADRELRKGYRAIARKVRQAHARPVMATITTVNERFRWPCEEQRVRTNDWIRNTFRTVVDLEPVLANSSGELAKRFDSGDGVHPNERGARLLARAVVAELRELSRSTM